MDMSIDESVRSFSNETPPSARRSDSRRTLLYAAQKGMYEKRFKSPHTLSVLPVYLPSTPGKIVYNPFNTNIDLLESHTCSPTVFTKTESPEAGEFKWSIDDISRINPALIDSPADLPEEEVDEKMENRAQEAIERYFSFRHDIVSPLGPPGQWGSPGNIATPASSSTPCHGRSHKVQDVACQTGISLPFDIPADVLEAAHNILKPYLQKVNEESDNTDECNVSNSTLRRKLFFNKEEEFISPVKKACYDDSGANDISMKTSRIDWTLQGNNDFSSPDISPIKLISEPMSVSGCAKDGIFTSTIVSGSQDTGYSTLETWRSDMISENNND